MDRERFADPEDVDLEDDEFITDLDDGDDVPDEDDDFEPGPVDDDHDRDQDSASRADAKSRQDRAFASYRRQARDAQRLADRYGDILDRVARLGGLSDREALIQQLEMLDRASGFQQGGAGVPQSAAPQNTTNPHGNRDVHQIMAEHAYRTARQAQLDAEIQALKADPFYADIGEKKEQVLQFAQQYGLTAKAAYMQLYGEERAKKFADEQRQKALKEAHRRSQLFAEPDFGAAEPRKLGITDDEYEFAVRSGLDPKEYAAMKQADSLDKYEAALRKGRRR